MAACAPRWPSRSGSPVSRQASRAWPARAAARRCPESCSGSWIRALSTAWRRGCRRARPSSRPPTARRRPLRWSRGSSGRPRGWRTTAPGPTSSPASPPRSSPPGTPSSGCSRWTRQLCRRWQGASRLARCRSATSFATSSTATASSSWWPSAGARWPALCPRRRRSWRTATTRSSVRSPRNGLARWCSASTTRATPRPASSTRPTRSGASAAGRRTTTPPPTSGISATTGARRAATPGHRSRSRRGRSS